MLDAIILGIVQGLTEFLPVSSSGHLVIVPYLVPGLDQPPLVFGVAVHAGSLVAVVAYFRTDLLSLAARGLGRHGDGAEATSRARTTLRLLAIASVPAAFAGLVFEAAFEDVFAEPQYAAAFLLVTGATLLVAERSGSRESVELSVCVAANEAAGPRQPRDREVSTMSVTDALAIGVAQAFAILPGISRSGATIAVGMVRGFSREEAARFSFLLSIPIILGAFAFSLPDLFGGSLDASQLGGPALVAGMGAAAASGYWAIRFLLRLVATRSLLGFARYVVVLGLVTLGVFFFT